MLQVVILIIYSLAILFIFLYSIIQMHLSLLYIRSRKNKTFEKKTSETRNSELPFVTIQLPIYNEKYVAERLIDSVAAFDYPSDKFEILILDDSDDETSIIIDEAALKYSMEGLSIFVIRRDDRVGYKAGALQYGLNFSHGELIAFFDADFLPPPQLLKETIPYFDDPAIGLVQTRWEHLNENYNLLTRMQAFALDAHFSVEQCGRNSGGFFINFNGTGGIWRKKCIEDSGGWQHDTLTEDLDLSYRAQMKGWKFRYLEHIGTPAELPPHINALKSQQFRWTKGAAENVRKHLLSVLKSDASVLKKVHASFHLLNSIIFVCVFLVATLSIPLLIFKSQFPEYKQLLRFAAFSLLSFLFLGLFYFIAYKNSSNKKDNSITSFLWKLPLFLAMSMGISFHNSLAVIRGLIKQQTAFIRTPKFSLSKKHKSWENSGYENSSLNIVSLMEGFFMLYFIAGCSLAFYLQDFSFLPFHFLLSIGFGLIFYYDLKHTVL